MEYKLFSNIKLNLLCSTLLSCEAYSTAFATLGILARILMDPPELKSLYKIFKISLHC